VIAALESGRTSWTSVLDAVRLGPDDDEVAVTAAQLRDLITRLIEAGHWHDGDPPILVIFDAGYDVTRLAWLLADLPAELLGRRRSDRVMQLTAPPHQRGTVGRWPWRIITAHTPLRLARPLPGDLRLPWERPALPGRFTPAQVRRGFRNIRATAPTQPVHRNRQARPRPPARIEEQRAALRHDVGKPPEGNSASKHGANPQGRVARGDLTRAPTERSR
jgi:hypothetical protein